MRRFNCISLHFLRHFLENPCLGKFPFFDWESPYCRKCTLNPRNRTIPTCLYY
ncbi:hypothetical protein RchiOBHm_Chr1g0338031 [Rosa chinensis]|uniref:Uncharacterized protein n=1 Tax=Rosa chinensis TaxID=74649 RepID=A0A2P6SD40_ROSCH|nr:hypothetical protein RchiOBHm_Chr1g0338031 [Rosa chinensis]